MTIHETAASRPFSRRTLLKGAGAMGVGFTAAQIGFVRSAAAESAELQEILNITATTERFGVTVLGAALASEAEGNYNKQWPDAVRAIVTAARAQEQFHLDAFESLGGEAITGTFTIPEALLTNFDAFFSAVVALEAHEIALQMTSMHTFAEMKRADIAKVSFQYAAEEAEHRVLANYALGTRPALDTAFAPSFYDEPSDHVAFVKEQGLIGGSGRKFSYPGPGEIDASNVTNRTPDGPMVACAPAGMPESGGGGMSGVKGAGWDPGESFGLLGILGLSAAALGLRTRRVAASREE
ncbi:MAG: hypothetical protein M3P51_05095 [Chloroflexota bacterium]|nr:hypothetical protein [Chloroflexota bacterium]